MAEDTPDPAAGEVGDEPTAGAALIATFYGKRDSERLRDLHKLFYQRLGPPTPAAEAPVGWPHPDETTGVPETTGLWFHPRGPGAHDTTAVQLSINALGGDGAGAWEGLREKLEGVLAAADLKGIWGYTLVYQVVVKEGHDLEEVLEQVLPAARRLHSAGDLAPPQRFEVEGGRACLLGLPYPAGGPDAGMVYAALAYEGEEKALLEQFYSRSKFTAELLPPDLIAHKGYYEMRQYRTGDRERRYQQSLKNLRKTTDSLLDELQYGGASSDRLDELFRLLDELFRLHSQLLSVASSLKGLRVGILEQSDNLDKWRSQFGDNEALQFHQDHLNIAIRELESKVEPLQFDLEIADKAVSAARLQLDKEQDEKNREAENEEQRDRRRQEDRRQEEEKEENRYQKLIQTLLAVVAVALAVPQLIDRSVAGRLIGLIPGLEPPPEGNILVRFLEQSILVVFFGGLIVGVVSLWLNRRRKRYRADNIEETISRYQQALEVYTREDFKVQWAGIHNDLAKVYLDRIRGDRADNVEEAIFHYEQALEVYIREDFPLQWATTRNNLDNARSQRIRGERNYDSEDK